ncbi:MAG: phosphate ABC transporter permease subunit PstC [Bacteroidetes bacterium]|nr:MAG: phosphate ABC transporter permease subunit PstC [Bacteroidota bacterium]
MDTENTTQPSEERSDKTVSQESITGHQHARFVFSNDSLKKRRRPAEFFAEKTITGVAFLSIAIIILIFLFVFRETIPIFSGKAESKTEAAAQKQENYGNAAGDQNANQQEVYGGSEPSTKPAKQEVYGANPDTTKDTVVPGETGVSSFRETSSEAEGRVTMKGLAGKVWMPVSANPRYGLLPLIIGTFKITIIAILFAGPLAILAALFSAAFAPRWMREIIKPAIEILAGFPSVVIGFFALIVMATFFQHLFGYETRLNAFVGGVAMALAAIPIIFTVTEDVMTAVPSTYKEASLALGASKWQTAFFVTLPAAAPGIFAAVLLGIGRIFGETMIVLMATGNAAMISMNPFDSVRTLSATIGAEMAEVVFGDTHYSVLFLIGTLLFVFTFALNATAEFYVKGKLMTRLQGKV